LKKLIKYKKWIYLGLGLAVLAVSLLPLFTLNIGIFGNSSSMEFSLRMIFQNIGGSNGNVAFGDLVQFGHNDFAREIILPFGAYLLTLLLIIIGTVFAFLDKFKTVTSALLVVALGSIVYVGFGFINLPTVLGDAITDLLGNNPLMGVFASMINISEIVSINLGVGYWLTMAFIITFVVVKFTLDFVVIKPQVKDD